MSTGDLRHAPTAMSVDGLTAVPIDIQQVVATDLTSASPDRTVVNSYPPLYETTYLRASFEQSASRK